MKASMSSTGWPRSVWPMSVEAGASRKRLGFEFVDAVKGGAIPAAFIPAVWAGVREALESGPWSEILLLMSR